MREGRGIVLEPAHGFIEVEGLRKSTFVSIVEGVDEMLLEGV